jgi:3-methyladenine DNA glycosylase AlkD
MPAARTRALKAKPQSPKAAKSKAAGDAPRTTLAEVMKTLEKAGSAQTKKIYAKHGATEPMFGVQFGTLKPLQKKIRVDHDLALALWGTGNFDARNLAFRVVDPARMTPADLDRWARDTTVRMCAGYVSMVAVEGPHGFPTASRWLASKEEVLRCAAWGLVGQLAARDEATPDAWFLDRIATIEKGIHQAPNTERGAMNGALIAIGGRNQALRKAALAAAKRIGKVEVDHGDTSCETPDAASYVEKMWAHSKAKGFASPSEAERSRESGRTRC